HDCESKLPVQLDGCHVGAYDVVELHRSIPRTPGLDKAVLDQGATDAPALGGGSHQVGGACNVRAGTGVIGAVLVHAKDIGAIRGKVRGLRAEPVRLERPPVEVDRERQGVPGNDDLLEDLPHRCKIGGDCRSDFHGDSSTVWGLRGRLAPSQELASGRQPASWHVTAPGMRLWSPRWKISPVARVSEAHPGPRSRNGPGVAPAGDTGSPEVSAPRSLATRRRRPGRTVRPQATPRVPATQQAPLLPAPGTTWPRNIP